MAQLGLGARLSRICSAPARPGYAHAPVGHPPRSFLWVQGGHTGGVWSVAVSEDGRLVASAGFDGVVRLWDSRTLREVRTLRGHQRRVRTARELGPHELGDVAAPRRQVAHPPRHAVGVEGVTEEVDRGFSSAGSMPSSNRSKARFAATRMHGDLTTIAGYGRWPSRMV